MLKLSLAYLGLVTVMSLLAFAAYGIDKYQARTNGWRISERRLQRLSLWGGWPGALLGQKFFRHKTQKQSFQTKFWAIVLLHLCLLAVAVYGWMTDKL